MKTFTYVLFYGYIVTLILAGAWGVFFATLDHRLLFHLDVRLLARVPAASLVSQYRFMRAIECGFGMFSVIYHREIFTVRAFNRLFLGTMAFGVAARFVSFILDGRPFPVFYVFLAWELIGIVFIYVYSRGTLERG
jgi:uncharacterized protein DUF4345